MIACYWKSGTKNSRKLILERDCLEHLGEMLLFEMADVSFFFDKRSWNSEYPGQGQGLVFEFD